MKHLKKAASALLALAMVLSLAACSNGGASATPTPSAAPAPVTTPSAAPAEGHYPVTVTSYNTSREPIEVTFDKAPERVVCDCMNSVENMIALGLEDRIILAASVSRDEVLPQYADGMAKIPEVVDSFPSTEDILAAEPDFILAWFGSFGEKMWGETEFWQERGINTYMARNSGIGEQNLQNEYDDILNLGKIFDVEEKAEALVAEMQAKVESGRDYAATQDPVSVIIVEDQGDSFRVYHAKTIGGDIAVQVGAELVAPDSKTIGIEDLVQLNPQVIFSVHFGPNSSSLNDKNCLDVFSSNPVFENVDAVKNGRLYPIDLGLVYCPGVRVADAINYFVDNLYPEL